MKYFSAMCIMFGLLVVIGTVGAVEQDTISLSRFTLSIAAGLGIMLLGLVTSKR